MSKSKLTACDVEIAVARMFGFRDKIIVPNVSWGLHGLGHEADLLVISTSGWCKEIEIKVSASDIHADLSKHHSHDSKLVKELYFAVPTTLSAHPDIPAHAGIITVDDNLRAEIIRRVHTNKRAVKLNAMQMEKLMQLGCMRIWSLKVKLMSLRRHNKQLQQELKTHEIK